MLGLLHDTLHASVDILNGASVWLVISFIIAGLLHNILSPDKFQRMLGNTRPSSLIKATISGMLLPICSCGVIPLGLGLYYSGAYLGPTLAFMTATPIINPAAVLLAYGLLGPQIATIYLITGFTVPFLIGLIANFAAGPELHAPGIEPELEQEKPVIETDKTSASLSNKFLTGLQWGFADLGVMVSKFVILGMLLAGFIMAVVPDTFIQNYLGNPGLISIGGVAILGAVMYVCAVGHIPFIAALVASGASPGIAITFLMTGAATNLPELISIGKIIGKRAVAIYSIGLVSFSMLVGYLTNKLLLPGFSPVIDLSRTQNTIAVANKIIFTTPEPIRVLCSLLVVALGVYAYWPKIKLAFSSSASDAA